MNNSSQGRNEYFPGKTVAVEAFYERLDVFANETVISDIPSLLPPVRSG